MNKQTAKQKAVAKAKAIASASTKQVNTAKTTGAKAKTSSQMNLDGEFAQCVRGYKAWKQASNADYQMFGEGFANIRGCELRFTSKRETGQAVFITVDKKGMGFLIGKLLNKNSMACGNTQVRLDVKKIKHTFKTYGDAVKFVFNKGEKNVKGCASDVRAFDTGAQYVVISNGKRLTKVNRGQGTGSHSEFTTSVKALENSSTFKR